MAASAAQSARLLSLLFVALALGPSLAHLLELPNKIGLPAHEYFVVQQIYRGWALLGFVTAVPENWESLRAQWEHSHAAAAVLNLTAFVALVLAALAPRERGRDLARR